MHTLRTPFFPAALLLLFLMPHVRAQDAAPSPRLQAIVDRAVAVVVEKFTARKLATNQLAVTLVDLRDPAQPTQASHRGDAQIYPASVIKLFYLAAAHRWMEDGKLPDTEELRRAMGDMIIHSYNEATGYVVDSLTDTTSGPELPEKEITEWFEKRNAVNRYFASLGYPGVNANKKPWCEGPYGRETQASKLFKPTRNALTTAATARLMTEIVTGKCVSAPRSTEMMKLLQRDPFSKKAGADDQGRGFTGGALQAGDKLWSKAGWTSQTRHDAAYVELTDGNKFILVIFTTDHANERDIIPTLAKVVAEGLSKSAK